MTCKIVRHYQRTYQHRTIRRGLTLEEAYDHCRDPETSSTTCCLATSVRRTRKRGPWFDSYSEE